jgi:hypothetical protein
MLLKGSQVTSLQQREMTMQKKLYQTLHYAYENIAIHFSVSLPVSQALSSTITSTHTTTATHNTSHLSATAHSTEITLPELLNITRSCFEDLVRWEQNLNLNHGSIGGLRKKFHHPHQEEGGGEQGDGDGGEEEENRGENLRRSERGMMGREPFLRRKPPTIPRR